MNRQAICVVALGSMLIGCAKNGGMMSNNPPPPSPDAIKNVPMNADTHYAAAELALARGAIPQAVEQYKAALKLKPDHLGALYGLGCLQTQMRVYPQAIATWKQYVKATGGSAVAYSDLAYCEEAAGNSAAAANDYQRGILKDPNNEACRVNYGLMLAREGQISQATAELSTVLSQAEVHYDLGSVYEAQKDKVHAKVEYQKAASLDPSFEDAKAKLASID